MFSFHIATPSTQCNIQRHKRYLRNYELITWQSSTSAAAPPHSATWCQCPVSTPLMLITHWNIFSQHQSCLLQNVSHPNSLVPGEI